MSGSVTVTMKVVTRDRPSTNFSRITILQPFVAVAPGIFPYAAMLMTNSDGAFDVAPNWLEFVAKVKTVWVPKLFSSELIIVSFSGGRLAG